jgi:glycosyltransferase involved in cell wall biosynthesis
MVSIVVPAHNEAQVLAGTLEALQRAAASLDRPWEIVVVDDASTDATARIAGDAVARVVSVNLRHIAAVRNAGARAAHGDTLVFVDADTVVPPETLAAAVRALEAGAAGGGAHVAFDGPLPWYARPGTAATLGFLRLFTLAAGCFVFCTRRTFEAVGGFDERLFAAEEIAFSVAVKRVGRMVLVRPAVVTSARKFRTHSARELTRMTMAALHLGRRMRSREHLHLWYGDRRHDPGGDGSAEETVVRRGR